MNPSTPPRQGRLRRAAPTLGAASLLGLLAMVSPMAHAVDGCKVMLCLAGNWKQIAPCQPEVRQALRDVAKGRGWPSCSMASSGGSNGSNNNDSGATTPSSAAQAAVQASSDAVTATEHQWTWAPGNCPEQYVLAEASENGPIYSCRYSGVINVWVAGSLWSRVWWVGEGDTATEYSAAARARLGSTIDPKFDDDLAAYRAEQAAKAAAAAAAAEQGSVGGSE